MCVLERFNCRWRSVEWSMFCIRIFSCQDSSGSGRLEGISLTECDGFFGSAWGVSVVFVVEGSFVDRFVCGCE